MTQDTKQEEKRTAVYVPYKTFLTSIEILDQGLPDVIDPSAWQSFSGGVRSQVLSAYKFLGLINEDGNVQQSLRDLIGEKEKESRKKLLAKLLRERYKLVVAKAESNGTQSQFEDEMRKYSVTGETLEKAIRFYLQAAAALALPVSTLWNKKAKGSRKSSGKRKAAGRREGSEDDDGDDDDEEPTGDSVEIDFDGAGTLTLTVSIAPTKLPKNHRDFVFKLIDEVNEYSDQMRTPKAAINGRSVPAVLE